jgi:aspartyl aminopeptidase
MADKKTDYDELKEKLIRKPQSAWHGLPKKEHKAAYSLSEDYKTLLDEGKNERFFVRKALERAVKKGFKPFNPAKPLKEGDKVYFENRGKTFFLL